MKISTHIFRNFKYKILNERCDSNQIYAHNLLLGLIGLVGLEMMSIKLPDLSIPV